MTPARTAREARSARVAAPVALALTVVLAGCGSDDDAGSTATPSTSASASASASAPASSGSATTTEVVAATNAFLDTLSDEERDTVLYDSDDTAAKQNWSNLPLGLYEWEGLQTGSLDDTKLQAGLAALRSIMSQEGYDRVVAAWTADDQLATGGGGMSNSYGRDNYFFAVIGEPSETEPWQFRFGGHHITINATISGDALALTPSFIGAQPEQYDADGGTVRVLGDIEDEAFALVGSLDSTQQEQAVLGSSAIDLVLGPGQDGKTIQTEGLLGADMTAEQQAAFLDLISEYGGLAADEQAAARRAQLEADLPETAFAWYGPTAEGSAAYFRVTGPHVVIEYSPQSMGGDATNHIHGIYRDPTNDYGGTLAE